MSKHDKQLRAMRNNPKNIRFSEIRNVLLRYGFYETAPGGGSSHYTYHRDMYRITIPKDNPVNSIYVKRVIAIIDRLEDEL